jgi:antitoxin component YwqK of YwqJK toxin-antitoxin module
MKSYYDDKLQVLSNNDTLNATYYRVINYRNGIIYGAVVDYYKSGRPLMRGYFADNNVGKGHENGAFTWYYENGAVFQTCNYVNGVIDGAYVEYYPSGLKKNCVSYAMGDRNGCEYSWDETGKASVYNKDAQNCPCAALAAENITQVNNNNTNQPSYMTPAVTFAGHYNDDMPDGDYKLTGENIYYKAKGFEITAAEFSDIYQKPLPNSKIKLGQPIFLKLKLRRINEHTGGVNYNLQRYIEDTNGNVLAPSASFVRQLESEDTWILIRFGVQGPPVNNDAKEAKLSFEIKDADSDAILQGFVKFTAVP